MDLQITQESQAIDDAFMAGRSLRVNAFAGTGKTTLLDSLAREIGPNSRIAYIAYTAAMAHEAKRRFPGWVDVKTAHGFAFRVEGARFKHRLTKSAQQFRASLAERFHVEIRRLASYAGKSGYAIGVALVETLSAFLNSDALYPLSEHAPASAGEGLAVGLAALARDAFDDLSRPDGDLPITHDVYLKVWQLSGGHIGAPIILFDEAQDASPVMLAAVLAQNDAQQIFVGDQHQSIFEWRGAVNAMQRIDLPSFPLTQSWRFGQDVADIANLVLGAKGETLPVRGAPDRQTLVCDRGRAPPDAVLCRTNIGVVLEVESAIRGGQRPTVIGDIEDTCRLLDGAYELRCGRSPGHRDLVLFRDWGEMEEFAETSIGGTYAPIVRMVNERRERITDLTALIRGHVVEPSRADLEITTAHKAKGLQWTKVRLSDDFREFIDVRSENGRRSVSINEQEANLVYVALTRASEHLNANGYLLLLGQSLAGLGKPVPAWLPIGEEAEPARPQSGPLDPAAGGATTKDVLASLAERLCACAALDDLHAMRREVDSVASLLIDEVLKA
jgi:hypothetical protein